MLIPLARGLCVLQPNRKVGFFLRLIRWHGIELVFDASVRMVHYDWEDETKYGSKIVGMDRIMQMCIRVLYSPRRSGRGW